MKTIQFAEDHAPYIAGEVASLDDKLANQLIEAQVAEELGEGTTRAVKFLEEYAPYEPGHVVDLDRKLADQLIADGIAKAYQSAVLPATVVTGGAD